MRINKAIVIGRLGNNPELKKEGNLVSTRFFLGNSMVYNGKTEIVWYNILATGKQAKVITDNLKKGDLCCVEGSYTMDAHSVKASRITFLSSKG